MEGENGPPIVKAASDKRSYKLIKLRNGLEVLLISDPQVSDAPEDSEEDESGNDEPEDGMDTERHGPAGCADEQKPDFPFHWPQFQSHCTGICPSIAPFLPSTACTSFEPMSTTSQ